MKRSWSFLLSALTLLVATTALASPSGVSAFRNATVFTGVPGAPLATAFAVRNGLIVYVGDESGLASLSPERTEDMLGRFVMPGLNDAHMHPLGAGFDLLKCNLDYAALTVEGMQQRVKACIERESDAPADAWLEVAGWFQEAMLPAGVRTSRKDLDAIDTRRPIIVRSSFGHTVLANTRALELAGIDRNTRDPLGGRIWRDTSGEPTGLLEDAAFDVFDTLLPKPTAQQNTEAARAALAAMARQGITSFLDAWAPEETIEAFRTVQAEGGLTARAHFAPGIQPQDAADPDAAVARISALARRFDQGVPRPEPGLVVRHAKLLLDGVIAAPALTGSVLEPYRIERGGSAPSRWIPGPSRGPDPYFPAPALARLLVGLAQAGINPHLHADGDRAVRAALDGVAEMRAAVPGADVRPAIAHAEIVDALDMPRFRELDVTPVLSFQWGKPAGDTLGLRDIFGPERMAVLEPSGLLAAAGARIAFGSDWPVDALDQWFAFKVGVTRTAAPASGAEFAGRLGADPGLAAQEVLLAATRNAAFVLHQDAFTGSLQPGRLADFIVLDRNPLAIDPEQIAEIRVLRTVVGGREVYRAP